MAAYRLTEDDLPRGCTIEVWNDNTVWITVRSDTVRPTAVLHHGVEWVGTDRLRMRLVDFMRWQPEREGA